MPGAGHAAGDCHPRVSQDECGELHARLAVAHALTLDAMANYRKAARHSTDRAIGRIKTDYDLEFRRAMAREQQIGDEIDGFVAHPPLLAWHGSAIPARMSVA